MIPFAPKITQSNTFSRNPNHPIFNFIAHHKSSPKSPKIPSKMAACIDTPRRTEAKEQTQDQERSKFPKYPRSTYSDRISCVPFSQNREKSFLAGSIDVGVEEEDVWSKMVEEAKLDVEQEPILLNYYYNSILSHKGLEFALASHLSMKLGCSVLPNSALFELFVGVLEDDEKIIEAVKDDLRAVRDRDAACTSYVHCFLNFKGFLACQAHRISHKLWSKGRKPLALLLQSRVSEVFAVDIHPGARIGRGILLDHATGLVIGETAVIGNNVSILHNVTLGGTGKDCGDRHPKIGDGVLIGAGTCVLGNVIVGDGAKVGAGSVVLKPVPARTTAVGNPARLIGGKENPIILDKIPSFTMDHTSHIDEWSDYVI
ncbi:hypothetical protein Droror1_Dr00014700 [Drosera rotundifolia]